jgi:hypothetical protein
VSTLNPRTATCVIYQGDDLERLGELRREADMAERLAQEDLDAARRSARGAPLRGGDADPVAEAEAAFEAAIAPTRDAYDTFLDEAVERAVEVVVEALGRKRFRALVENHPVRMVKDAEGKESPHEDDDAFGVDTSTFPDALLTYRDGDKRTIVSPEFTPGALADFLDEEVSDGDYEKLWQTAYYLNRSPGPDPKATRYSAPSLS